MEPSPRALELTVEKGQRPNEIRVGFGSHTLAEAQSLFRLITLSLDSRAVNLTPTANAFSCKDPREGNIQGAISTNANSPAGWNQSTLLDDTTKIIGELVAESSRMGFDYVIRRGSAYVGRLDNEDFPEREKESVNKWYFAYESI